MFIQSFTNTTVNPTIKMTRRRLLFKEELPTSLKHSDDDMESIDIDSSSEEDDLDEDPDYHPTEDEDDEDEDVIDSVSEDDNVSESDASECENEPVNIAALGYNFRMMRPPSASILIVNPGKTKQNSRGKKSTPPPTHDVTDTDDSDTKPRPRKRPNTVYMRYKDLIKKMSPEEKTYFLSVSEEERETLFQKYKIMADSEQEKVPLRFRILSSPMPDTTKRSILQKLDLFQTMTDTSSEYHKYAQWIHSITRMPIGKYHAITVSKEEIAPILVKTRTSLDTVVYGHNDAKDHIMRILAQWISNPVSNGHCIGIQGPMGIGKTTLLKDGVSRALNIPFGFIALGGASDASFLEGHSFTYEGSTFGRIAEILMKTQIMNPILFFDELDKISDTPKGEEISSILTHLTDITQNSHYTDKYFGGIELDLSKCLMVFSFNDESKINPILKDRMTIIRVHGYDTDAKINIAKNYLLPTILSQYNLTSEDVHILDSLIRRIVELVPSEKGVRHLRRGLENIVSWINMARYIVVPPFTEIISIPFTLEESYLQYFLKTLLTDTDEPPPFMYT